MTALFVRSRRTLGVPLRHSPRRRAATAATCTGSDPTGNPIPDAITAGGPDRDHRGAAARGHRAGLPPRARRRHRVRVRRERDAGGGGPVRRRRRARRSTARASRCDRSLTLRQRASAPAKIPPLMDQQGFTLWLTGLPRSGKSTVAGLVAGRLRSAGRRAHRGPRRRHRPRGPVPGPRLLTRGPHREHPPHRLRQQAADPQRRRRDRRRDLPLPRGPRAGARGDPVLRRGLVPRVRRRLRRARLQGPLREGAARRDHAT